MKNLNMLQDRFQDYLLEGNTDFKNMVADAGKTSVETRLGIYSNAYKARLIEALASNYPVISQFFGETHFETLASRYIDQFPSRYRSIRWFGEDLHHFLTHDPEYRELPYLSELAKFEWLQTLVFDAADHSTVQLENVAKIPPEYWANMKLYPHPSLHRIDLCWNVVQLWQAVADDQIIPEPIQSQNKISWILWRKDLTNRFCSLSDSEAWAIDALFQHFTFGQICEGLCQWVDEDKAGIHAASILKGWITSGLIADITQGERYET